MNRFTIAWYNMEIVIQTNHISRSVRRIVQNQNLCALQILSYDGLSHTNVIDKRSRTDEIDNDEEFRMFFGPSWFRRRTSRFDIWKIRPY